MILEGEYGGIKSYKLEDKDVFTVKCDTVKEVQKDNMQFKKFSIEAMDHQDNVVKKVRLTNKQATDLNKLGTINGKVISCTGYTSSYGKACVGVRLYTSKGAPINQTEKTVGVPQPTDKTKVKTDLVNFCMTNINQFKNKYLVKDISAEFISWVMCEKTAKDVGMQLNGTDAIDVYKQVLLQMDKE